MAVSMNHTRHAIPPRELVELYDSYAQRLRDHSRLPEGMGYSVKWLVKKVNKLARNDSCFANYMVREHWDVAVRNYDGEQSILQCALGHRSVRNYLATNRQEWVLANTDKLADCRHTIQIRTQQG